MFNSYPGRRRMLPLTFASIIAMTMVGCGSSVPQPEADPSSSAAGSTEETDIAFVAAQMASTYFQVMQCGAEAAAEEFDVNLDWQGDPQWSLQTQLPLINAAMQSEPDGLVIVPTDSKALIDTVDDIMEGGTPVITVDGSLAKEVEVQNIRTDNIGAGAKAAEALAESIGGSGSVLVVASEPGITANQERITGFKKTITENYSDISLLPVAYAGDDQSEASQLVSAAIAGDSDLAGIYTTLAPASNGAAAALRAAGKQGEIKLVAYDSDPVQVKGLRDGVFEALVAQDPYGLGYDSVARLAKIAKGEMTAEELEYQEYVEAFIITEENVDTEEATQHIYEPNC